MPTILLSNKYSHLPLHIITQEVPIGFNLMMLETVSEEELLSKIHEADYLLASGRLEISEMILKKALKLKMIQRTGVGIDMIDINALKKYNIPLYINSGINADSVAEHTILLMLSVLRRLPTLNNEVHSGIWIKQENGVQNRMLKGRKVGIIGMGNIGQHVAVILSSFGAKVMYHDMNRLNPDKEKELNIEFLSFEDLLQKSEILSLHCSLTPITKNLINEHSLKQMNKDIIIINTARGGLIDDVALCKALESGSVKGVGLDVFAKEPINENNALLKFKNVIMTPHIGGITYDSFHSMMAEAMQNIRFFEEGRLDKIENKKYHGR